MVNGTVSWNKVWTVVIGLGVPAISIVVAVVIWGTKLDDKLSTVVYTQLQQGMEIRDIKEDLRSLHTVTDTIQSRQRVNSLEINYRLQSLKKK